jgi:hypothetical protein
MLRRTGSTGPEKQVGDMSDAGLFDGVSVIWIIPRGAVAIGAWLAWDTLSKQGPTIRRTACRGVQEDRRLGEITCEPVSLRVVQKEEERHAGGTAWRSRARSDRKELGVWGEPRSGVSGPLLFRVASTSLMAAAHPRQLATLGALLGDCGARELAAHPRSLAGSRWHSPPTGGADRSYCGSRQNARV